MTEITPKSERQQVARRYASPRLVKGPILTAITAVRSVSGTID